MHNRNKRRSCRAATLAFLIASGAAYADPPYGNDFDAPDTPDAAVRIEPNRAPYAAGFEGPADTDFYRFLVADGADIRVECTQVVAAVRRNWQPVAAARVPCAIELIDPMGVPRGLLSLESSPAVEVRDAQGGEWRLGAAGKAEVLVHIVTYCWPLSICPTETELIKPVAAPPQAPYSFQLIVRR